MKILCLSGWGFEADALRGIVRRANCEKDSRLLSSLDFFEQGDSNYSEFPSAPARRLQGFLEGNVEAGEKVILLAWSLGGELALELSAFCPEKISALLLVGTEPCFVGDGTESGISQTRVQELEQFKKTALESPSLALKAFYRKCSSLKRRDRSYAETILSSYASVLGLGLDYLGSVDHRTIMRSLKIPCLSIRGMRDEVLPDPSILARENIAQFRLENAGHALAESNEAEVACLLSCLLGACVDSNP